MKKNLFIIAITIILSTGLQALKNWQVYTNTTHIFEVIQTGDNLQIATWGGLANYNLLNNSFEETMTSIDGLDSNDIRALDYLEGSNEILVGTAGNGIDRIKDNSFLTPLTETLGLQSNIVNVITHNDTLIFVATKFGVSCFKDEAGFPFPLLLKNYNIENGLSANDITSMQLSQDGNIFFGSIAGLDYVHIDSMEVATNWHYLGTPILLGERVSSISVNQEQLAIATDNGLQVFDDIINYPYQNEIIYQGDGVYPIYLDEENNIWYGFGFWDDQVLFIQDSTDIAIVKITDTGDSTIWKSGDNGLTTTKIKNIKTVNSQIALSTWGEGVFLFDGLNWSNLKTNSISANIVTDVEIDLDSNIWVCNGFYGDGLISKGTRGVSGYDGSNWVHYNYLNSGLKSDNINSIEIDQQNRKWFGAWATSTAATGWFSGISVLDNSSSIQWDWITASSSNIYNNTISDIFKDDENKMWICSFDGGVSVLDANASLISKFKLPNDENQKVIAVHNSGTRVCVGSYFNGLRIWEDSSIPDSLHNYWTVPPSSDLTSSCKVFNIESRNNVYIEETWIASSAGLFMYNGEFWYKYGPNIKKKVWDDNKWFWSEHNPDPEYWYYEGQERLYGSIPTYPTALFIDPFGMIWIGTQNAGITIFDTSRDTFTNLTIENSPLISNTITDFAYEPKTGTLYIGTNSGMNSVEIGISAEMNQETKLFDTVVYPNPYYPENDELLRIENVGSITMPEGDTYCRIFDLEGTLVIEMEKDIYEQFSWDGLNKAGKKCSSGIYFYVVSAAEGQTSKGKIVLVR